MEVWDGYYRDGTKAGVDLVRGRPIPAGLYHLVCNVLVHHKDGSYLLMQRDFGKKTHPGRYEATAGGSALKGEDPLTCIRRELREETGIAGGTFTELSSCVCAKRRYLCHAFLCETDCDKSAITLQQGETIAYRWLTEPEFKAFIHSKEMMENRKVVYNDYFIQKGYL